MRFETFHDGEITVQEMVMGKSMAKDHRENVGKYIRTFMPMQHVEFYEEARWLIAASLDVSSGWPRASILQRRGAKSSIFAVPKLGEGQDHKDFELSLDSIIRGDRFLENVSAKDAYVGILGIELETRRRNRVNGFVRKSSERSNSISISVTHSFGNCPKYIQSRDMEMVEEAGSKVRSLDQDVNHKTLSQIFGTADTFFIASGNNKTKGVDVSHRGGPQGFVQVNGENHIRFPDYVGNGFFNTLGNIHVDPRVGLLVVDFKTGTMHQVSGNATIEFSKDPTLPGSERVVNVHVVDIHTIEGGLKFKFAKPEFSPFNPSFTGDEVRVVAVMEETHDVRTLLLEVPRPIRYAAGQFGTFRVESPALTEAAIRTWTFSSTPRDLPFGEQKFTITVKRKDGGLVSPLFHDDHALGRLKLSLTGTGGDFTLTESELQENDTVMFAAAGSGITPVMSILRAVVGRRSKINIHVYYSVTTPEDIIFADELQKMVHDTNRLKVTINVTQQVEVDDEDAAELRGLTLRPGRMESNLDNLHSIEKLFICGPIGFSETIYGIFSPIAKKVVSETFNF